MLIFFFTLSAFFGLIAILSMLLEKMAIVLLLCTLLFLLVIVRVVDTFHKHLMVIDAVGQCTGD